MKRSKPPENIQAAKADIPVKEDVVKTAEAKITPAENKAETTAKELQEAQAKRRTSQVRSFF